ncbi:hypothetical protein U5922_016365 [Aquicoccus sp. G2-2]|uniref:hypothetical protein n=1 Tax=Aquicoccus sp. G2-2 TaxID=3092120 RepID=UPI002ADFB4C1|nr:hypothetical protein [Aquicoccus sp. G2-2]MEA1114960.1 hypothetical protein [Aquicoccus sp. G2-2]
MNVSILAQDEPVQVDSAKLEALYRQLGDASAEDIMCRAMEELAVRLSQAEAFFRGGKTEDLRKTARLIAAISEQIGMQMLSVVGTHVVQCIEAGDDIALAAVLARLIRVGERSLTEIWELQNFSL